MNRLIPVFFLLFSFSAFAQEAITLKFERTSWNIAMENLTGDLSDRYSYFKSSIPDLLIKALEQADTHVLSAEEKKMYRMEVVESKKAGLISQLAKAISARDNLLFSAAKNRDTAADTQKNIGTIKDQINALEKFDASQIKTADMLPASWVYGDGDGGLFEPGLYTPRVVCLDKDLDFLIGGELREIDDYFRLEIWGFDRASGKKQVFYTSAGPVGDVESMAGAAADELRSFILGRAWSAVKILADDPDSLIYSDGVLIGVGTAEAANLNPGKVLFEAVGLDNSYWSAEVELAALEHKVISATLSGTEKTFVAVNSEPDGADVYIGARWAGKTPLNLPRYRERNLWVTLKSEGYYEKSFEVSMESPDYLSFALEEETITRLEDFDLKKKAFYRSLGVFSLSLAGPMISAGINNNYLTRYNAYIGKFNSTYDAAYLDLADEMERNWKISEGVVIGTVAVSGGLLIDVFVKLSRYIKAAEALAE